MPTALGTVKRIIVASAGTGPRTIVALVGFSLLTLLCVCLSGISYAQSTETLAHYYRLKASYLHGSEHIDFDIVAGCGVQITRSPANGDSFDAVRYPSVYGKITQGGGAILQLVTAACKGETTASGQVPRDFLPGVIWFGDKSDLSLGVGYFTEDAFENPMSELKFLGATVEAATEADWQQFQSTLAGNLIDARALIMSQPWPTEAEVKSNMWGKQKLAKWTLSSFGCWAVERLPITDARLKSALAQYRPKNSAAFWFPGYPALRSIFKAADFFGRVRFDGEPFRSYAGFGSQPGGFPTRARGGRLLTSVERKQLPPTVYPLSADDGVPWASREVTAASTISRRIEYAGGANKGFADCYSLYSGRGAMERLLLPNYGTRLITTTIDGQPIITGEQAILSSRTPDFFFEGDGYLYHTVNIGLY